MTHARKDEAGSDLKPSDIRLLAAIGFASARAGLAEQSRTIFEGLASARPHSAFPYIGLALANLCIGEPENAASILRNRGLSNLPDDVELRIWLALALKYSGQSAHAAAICKSLQGEEAGPELLEKFNQALAGLVIVASGDSRPQQPGSARLVAATS